MRRAGYRTALEWHERNGSDSTFSRIGLGAVSAARAVSMKPTITSPWRAIRHPDEPSAQARSRGARTGWRCGGPGDLETAARMLGWIGAVAAVITGDLSAARLATGATNRSHIIPLVCSPISWYSGASVELGGSPGTSRNG
jgi:hypothetical protein